MRWNCAESVWMSIRPRRFVFIVFIDVKWYFRNDTRASRRGTARWTKPTYLLSAIFWLVCWMCNWYLCTIAVQCNVWNVCPCALGIRTAVRSCLRARINLESVADDDTYAFWLMQYWNKCVIEQPHAELYNSFGIIVSHCWRKAEWDLVCCGKVDF